MYGTCSNETHLTNVLGEGMQAVQHNHHGCRGRNLIDTKADGSSLQRTPCVSYKNQPMHTCIINTTLLTLCYSNICQPLKDHFQDVRLMYFNSRANKICTVPDVKFNFVGSLYCVMQSNTVPIKWC